jgi:anti-anti-sigma regulatory factor
MSDDCESTIMIGRIETGYVVVVVGRGTCRESAALEQFTTEAFRTENCSVTVDLSGCNQLDSTFLGCLVTLQKRFGAGHPSRFVVAASPEQVQKLLTPSKLDKFLEITANSPRIQDTLMILPESKVDQFQMGRHVMECHRLLADLGGPNAAAFAAVADRLEQELGERRALAD